MKRKDRNKKEEMMFLGVDGFEEIETLGASRVQEPPLAVENTEKSGRGAKKAKSRTKLSEKIRRSGALSASELKRQPAHMEGVEPVRRVYKKKVVIGVAAGVFVVMLTFVTVAGALDGADRPAPDKGEIAVTEAPTEPAAATVPTLGSTFDEPVSLIGVSGRVESELTALYIEDELIGVTSDGKALSAALDKILADAKEGYDSSTTTSFANKVEIKPYEGDRTPVSVDELMEETQYMYAIRLETDWIYEEEVPYETEIIEDDTLPEGYEEITQEGQTGVTRYTVRLCFVNGEQVDAITTDETPVIEVVNEKKTVGTAGRSDESGEESGDDYDSYSYEGSSSGFIWPLPHTHNITSYNEWRWGRMHNGIDIAGGDDYGQPFIASDSGTVIWSGNDGGGYGNYVMIDHGNGYMTVYGHASELNCSTGDYVDQGDVIGFVGSTGNSTGPHLHFEIRYDGEYQNPLNYVS